MANDTQSHDAKKNIYQRMIGVQKDVQTVFKNETVKMSDNDKGYKAVTHDDVAAALHLPLANHGVFMMPDLESFENTQFEKTNQWGKTVTWYRTDLKIKVKWINVDDPKDFIEGSSAAFALDTSDKSFAKAYSLALKIILLKVHLLESRDNEDQRPFDEANGGEKAGKGQNNKQNNPPEKPKEPQSEPKKGGYVAPKPVDFVMLIGENNIKGKKLGELDLETLKKIDLGADAKLKEVPEPKNKVQWVQISTNVKAVIKILSANVPKDPPALPDDQIDPQISPNPENETQEVDLKGKPKQSDPADIVINIELETPETFGKALKQISENSLKAAHKEITAKMSKAPPPANLSELFTLAGQIKAFLKSNDVSI